MNMVLDKAVLDLGCKRRSEKNVGNNWMKRHLLSYWPKSAAQWQMLLSPSKNVVSQSEDSHPWASRQHAECLARFLLILAWLFFCLLPVYRLASRCPDSFPFPWTTCIHVVYLHNNSASNLHSTHLTCFPVPYYLPSTYSCKLYSATLSWLLCSAAFFLLVLLSCFWLY